jgi:hypothetical protein
VPLPLKATTVRSQNDLKPTISTFRSLSKVSPLVVNFHFAMHRRTCCARVRRETAQGSTARRETTFLSSRGGSFTRRFCP